MRQKKLGFSIGGSVPIELPDGFSLDIVLDDWVQEQGGWVIPVSSHMVRDTPDLSRYVTGLPDASGSFSGTYDAAVAAPVLGPLPDLLPVEVDTGSRPNLMATAPAGSVLTFVIGDRTFRMTVHRVERLGGNRVRALVWRKSVAELTEEDGDG